MEDDRKLATAKIVFIKDGHERILVINVKNTIIYYIDYIV